MTMDTITHISFGGPAGYLTSDQDVLGFTAVMEQLLPIVLHFSVFTELNSMLKTLARIPWCRRQLFPHYTHTKGLGKIRGVGMCPIFIHWLPSEFR